MSKKTTADSARQWLEKATDPAKESFSVAYDDGVSAAASNKHMLFVVTHNGAIDLSADENGVIHFKKSSGDVTRNQWGKPDSRWRDVLTDARADALYTASVYRDHLMTAIKSALVMARDNADSVLLTTLCADNPDQSVLLVGGKSAERGTVETAVQCSTNAPCMRVSFDGHYLLKALSAATAENVELRFCEDGRLYLRYTLDSDTTLEAIIMPRIGYDGVGAVGVFEFAELRELHTEYWKAICTRHLIEPEKVKKAKVSTEAKARKDREKDYYEVNSRAEFGAVATAARLITGRPILIEPLDYEAELYKVGRFDNKRTFYMPPRYTRVQGVQITLLCERGDLESVVPDAPTPVTLLAEYPPSVDLSAERAKLAALRAARETETQEAVIIESATV